MDSLRYWDFYFTLNLSPVDLLWQVVLSDYLYFSL